MRRSVFNDDHEVFRKTVREFVGTEVVPVYDEWLAAGIVPRDFYHKLGELGLFGIEVPEEFGGAGEASYKYQAILTEEIVRAGVSLGGSLVHVALCLPYLLAYATDEQKARWLPGFVSGETMFAIAMTEPGTGSDLAGMRTTANLAADGAHYVLNGAKTFITGAVHADRVIVGQEHQGFGYLGHNLPRERLEIAIGAYAQAKAAVRFATEYVQDRSVFGQPVASFQNTKFELATCKAEVDAMEALVDRALEAYDTGELTPAEAAATKLFCTETASRVVDRCLQLHGGYGYINEYPIARLYTDNRVNRIYGGTSEVMKMIIAKDMGLP
jgi:alkylation response protein AidB-like acyl-CoA dehydrogenase